MMRKWLGGILVGTLAWTGAALGAPATIAYDEAGNYTPATFINGANLGTGFGAWDLWNKAAELGDSTAGGGGDLNSTNGYSFRFMGDGTNGWCNGKRNFDGALQTGDVLSFTFTYNWDGGGRGVDIFCATGQFANVINVIPGDVFQVNGQTVSTQWSPGAVVAVDITQLADGIQVHLTRATNGTENLNYTTNILNPEPATGFSLYCGGYSCAPADNVNYAIFMNDIEIVGEPRIGLTFSSGTWNPTVVGDYEFVLAREGAVGDEIVLTSSNTNTVTVPESATFVSNAVAFNATVVSLTSGPATLVASNEETGVWAEYVVTPVAPVLAIGGPWEIFALGPAGFILQRVGAVGDVVSLSSSAPGVLSVPVSATFGGAETQTTFNATANAFGAATITASNAASGAWATFDVTVAEPAVAIEGPTTAWTGGARFYALRRNSAAGVGANVNLSSSDTNVLAVPATAEFPEGATVAIFEAIGVAPGPATITADNDDVEPATFEVAVTNMPGVLAADHSGNYAPETFVDGANLGFGFGAWDFWNTPASLGDSTAGGGGDLNDTNGVAFRFMGDGAGGYCNARRDLAEALKPGDVMSFTFTYNWVGGGRGVDVFSAGGQFANLINVGEGNAFSVNGTVISTDYVPGAVVYVEIAQKADGIEVYLTRAAGGGVNLAYVTNVVHGEGATGVSMYCGGYVADPIENNVNFAIFMNALRVVGAAPTRLTFTGGTWDPAAVGDYEFELTRSGEVTDLVVLSSDNEAAVTVPPSVMFGESAPTTVFDATVVSLTNGAAKIVASNAATGAWAEYNVYPVAPDLGIDGPWLVYGLGAVQYTLTRTGAVGDEIALGSSDEGVATVPATATFGEGETAITFIATGVGYGATTLYATDAVSGATADYGVTFAVNPDQPIGEITFNPATGDLSFAIPAGFGVGSVYGADCQLVGGDWDWQLLTADPPNPDYTVAAGVVTILGDAAQRRIIRIGWLPD